jgi:diguanylate cyclase (GGDEF)-like protein
MCSVVRPYDSVGRYGGEEFVIVVPGCDSEDVLRIAERVRAELAKEPLVTPEGTFSVTMSLGVAALSPDEACDADAMIRIADEAMYEAKTNGRNRVALWRDSRTLVQPSWGADASTQLAVAAMD